MEQEVTRDSVTGRYEKKENKGLEDYTTTEDHMSPHGKELLRLIRIIENPEDQESLNFSFIDATKLLCILHGESGAILKRP